LSKQAYDDSLKFAIAGAQHAVQDVRTSATNCLVELYRVLGDKI